MNNEEVVKLLNCTTGIGFLKIDKSLVICSGLDYPSNEILILSFMLGHVYKLATNKYTNKKKTNYTKASVEDGRFIVSLSFADINSEFISLNEYKIRSAIESLKISGIIKSVKKGIPHIDGTSYDLTDFLIKYKEEKDLVSSLYKDKKSVEEIRKELSAKAGKSKEPEKIEKAIDLFMYIRYKAMCSFEDYVSPPFRTAVKSVVKHLFDNKEISLEDKKLAVDYATDSGEYDYSKFIIPFIFCQANIGVLIAKAKKWDNGGRKPLEDSAKFKEKFSSSDVGHKNKVGLKIIK